eukprot:UN24462
MSFFLSKLAINFGKNIFENVLFSDRNLVTFQSSFHEFNSPKNSNSKTGPYWYHKQG